MYESFTNVWRRWRNVFQDKPQTGDADTVRPDAETKTPTETAAPKVAVPEVVVREKVDSDPRAELENKCHALGDQVARKSWELETNDQTLQALEAKATAMALSLHRSPSEANDERRARKYKALLAELKKRLAARDRAKAVAQARRRELAALGPSKPRPTIPTLLRHAATLGLTISIAPTLHDLAVDLDPFLKWLVGGVAAWGLSLLIVHGLLPINAESESTPDKED